MLTVIFVITVNKMYRLQLIPVLSVVFHDDLNYEIGYFLHSRYKPGLFILQNLQLLDMLVLLAAGPQ